MSSDRVARPCIKFVGGKTALLPEILPRLPEKIGTYYEPFIGGGAVFFALAAEKRFESAVLSDVNEELMNMYAILAREPTVLIRELRKHVYDEKYYYSVRAQDPALLRASERAARFIYLNKSAFNGLYRVNKKGQFNVPFGRYTNPTICDEENLMACSTVIRGNTITVCDFERMLVEPEPGDAVYFDCPYWPASESANFTMYSKGGFTPDDQRRLRDCALQLKKRGVSVLLSNADVPAVRELYSDGFVLHSVVSRRRVNSKSDRRGPVGELLIA